MAVIEAISRQLPGFMHDADSATKDDHAQYTKPEVFRIKNKNQEARKKSGVCPKFCFLATIKDR